MLWGASPPFLAMRNAARYGQAEGLAPQQQWLQWGTQQAMQHTAFYKSRLTEHHVPSLLLADFARQDSKQREFDADQPQPRSILASCNVNGVGVLCCATGENLSDLMIAEVPNNITLKAQGVFPKAIAPLRTPIRQVALAGPPTGYGPSSVVHALARSQSALHYLRIEETNSRTINSRASEPSVCLDPVDRTTFPEEIVSMGVARSPGPNAVVLTSLGNLFEWSPNLGAVRYSSGCLFDNLPYELTFFREAERTTAFTEAHIECTLHPKIVLCSINDVLRQYDLRAPAATAATSSVLLYQSPRSSGPVTSICSHTSNPFHFYTTTKRRMMQFDSRLPSRPIWIRPTLDDISDLKLYNIQRSPEVHVLMASGVRSGSIQLTTLENSQLFDLHSALIGSDTAPERIVSGFPVVDKDDQAHLHGATLLPFRPEHASNTSSTRNRSRSNSEDSDGDTYDEEKRWASFQASASRDLSPGFLLWHANRHGDLFAQHLKYRHGMTPADLPDQAPIQSNVASGVRCEVPPKVWTRMPGLAADYPGETRTLPNPESSFMPYMDESSLKPVQTLPLLQKLAERPTLQKGKKSAGKQLSVDLLFSNNLSPQTHTSEVQLQLRQFLQYPRSLFELRAWLVDNAALEIGANELLAFLNNHSTYSVSMLSSTAEEVSLLQTARAAQAEAWLYENCCCTQADGQQACDLPECSNSHQVMIRSSIYCIYDISHPNFEAATTAPPSPPVYIPKDAKRRRNDLDEEMVSLLQAEWVQESRTSKRVSFGGPAILQEAASSSNAFTPTVQRSNVHSYGASWDDDFNDDDF